MTSAWKTQAETVPAQTDQTFEQWYALYHDRLVAACRRLLGDGAAAEDAAQETLLRAWLARDMLHARNEVYPWMVTVARNLCTDLLRTRQKVIVSDTLPEQDDHAADPTVPLEIEADRNMVRSALSKVSDRHRELLYLRDVQGVGYEELASKFGLSNGATRAVLLRARRALREVIESTNGFAAAVPPVLTHPTQAWGLVRRLASTLSGESGAGLPFATEMAAGVLLVATALAPLTDPSAGSASTPGDPVTSVVTVPDAVPGPPKVDVEDVVAQIDVGDPPDVDLSDPARDVVESVEDVAEEVESWRGSLTVGNAGSDPDSGLFGLSVEVEQTDGLLTGPVTRTINRLPDVSLDILQRPEADPDR